jgi:hypothetical protein
MSRCLQIGPEHSGRGLSGIQPVVARQAVIVALVVGLVGFPISAAAPTLKRCATSTYRFFRYMVYGCVELLLWSVS